jgi:hypothetical protein
MMPDAEGPSLTLSVAVERPVGIRQTEVLKYRAHVDREQN